MAEELLKTEYDAARVIYNRFKSAIAYKPTIATVLSPDVRAMPFCGTHWDQATMAFLCSTDMTGTDTDQCARYTVNVVIWALQNAHQQSK